MSSTHFCSMDWHRLGGGMWLCVGQGISRHKDYRTGMRTGCTGRWTERGFARPAAPSLSADAPSSRRTVSWHSGSVSHLQWQLQLKYKINSS